MKRGDAQRRNGMGEREKKGVEANETEGCLEVIARDDR